MHGCIYRTAEEVSELQSEDTDVGVKNQEKAEMFYVNWIHLLVSYRNN